MKRSHVCRQFRLKKVSTQKNNPRLNHLIWPKHCTMAERAKMLQQCRNPGCALWLSLVEQGLSCWLHCSLIDRGKEDENTIQKAVHVQPLLQFSQHDWTVVHWDNCTMSWDLTTSCFSSIFDCRIVNFPIGTHSRVKVTTSKTPTFCFKPYLCSLNFTSLFWATRLVVK